MATSKEPSASTSANDGNASAARRPTKIFSGNGAQGPGEEWMLTYMDTVTLLVTLFVMILSFANFDKTTFERFTDSMSLAKYGAGIMVGGFGLRESQHVPKSSDVDTIMPPKTAEDTSAPPRADQESGFFDDVAGHIADQGLEDSVSIQRHEGTIELQINEAILFPSARAGLSDAGRSVMKRLAGLLKRHAGTIAIEGHTDDRAINTDDFPSNWELSAARAASVARALIGRDINSTKVRIVGYADTKPVTPNTTASGRQKNRRVNIVLELPNGS